ncbi:MAG: DUF2806 domain-containing protein [Rhodobacteraceae bacterium]|nr:DUF2806 domain-containing protein [Paracoccaceae bacterium]
MENIPGINKLIEVVSSGIGAVADPMLAPWKAGREGKAKIESAKAAIEIAKLQTDALLETQKRIANSNPKNQNGDWLDGCNSERIRFQERKRLANIKSVARKAAHELESKEVPDQKPDHDWTARFFSSVQDVSSEDMQILWSKILAGQVKRPGSTSLRTLGVLQEMDRDTAKLFEKFCSMCMFLDLGDGIFDGRVCSLGKDPGYNSLQSFGLGFGKLNHLHEYGLIISDYNSWRDYSIPQQNADKPYPCSLPFHFQNNLWILTTLNNSNPMQEVKIKGPSLSISGLELSRIVECKQVPEFSAKLKSFFQTRNLRIMPVDTTTKEKK